MPILLAKQLNWELPYPSQRYPVCARNLVATSQPLATAAGVDVLRNGGNAVDAAIATAITLTVVEPSSNGIGSDAFALVWHKGQLYGLNASGRSPLRWRREHFDQYRQMPVSGWDSVTVPGAVSAWVALSDRFGCLPFERLFDAAIDYATNGFQVGARTAYHWARAGSKFGKIKAFRDHFLTAGESPKTGDTFFRPELSTTLKQIAQSKGESFYRGEIADLIVGCARAEGGLLNHEDLAVHSPDWCEPLSYCYGDVDVHELPPNGQGLTALIALGILDRTDLRTKPPGSTAWTHLQVEAMRIATRTASQYFADPNHMHVDPESFITEEILDELASQISSQAVQSPPPLPTVGSDTVYLCTADDNGTMVSFIQSNYMGFGSGIVVPGTGIALQNRGACFSLEPGHPNEVAGGKRPFHTIIPGFVTLQGQPLMTFGVMGGHMQPQGHVQMITRIVDHHQNPQAACDAPRWYVSPSYDLVLEQGYSEHVVRGMEKLGHQVSVSSDLDLFGGAQLIVRLEDAYCGASDHRKEGLVVGY